MATQRRIAVYGGSFNPFGNNHQDCIRWLAEEGGCKVILVVPSIAHALKTDLAPWVHRVNMAQLGVADLVHDGVPSLPFGASVQTSLVEMDMLQRQAPPIRTYELLCKIRKTYPQDEIKFAIGPDIPDELHRWHNVEKIEKEFGFLHLPVQSMRATKLRQMIREGTKAWKRHIPPPVRRYIEMHELYGYKKEAVA